MSIDLTDQLGAVTRELRDTERDGVPVKVIVATQTYPTDVEDLWDAVTNGERISRWFLPITGDLRVGGQYQLEGNAGGTVLACDPPRSMSITWENGGQVSWVDVTLTADGDDRAVFELKHTAAVPGEMWEQYGPSAVGLGWDMALIGLAQHFAPGRPTVDPAAALEWMMSESGHAFMRGSAAGWARAHAAADGVDLAVTQAAADRTFDLYTTMPDPEAGAAE